MQTLRAALSQTNTMTTDTPRTDAKMATLHGQLRSKQITALSLFADELEREADTASRLLDAIYEATFGTQPVWTPEVAGELRAWVKAYRERSAL